MRESSPSARLAEKSAAAIRSSQVCSVGASRPIQAAALASEADLGRASDDPFFQYVTSLPDRLPLAARGPGIEEGLERFGIDGSQAGRSLLLWPELTLRSSEGP